jgi:chemotaxis protein histidine kinase CheA
MMGTVDMDDPFAERIAAIRQRFIAKLDGRIDIIASATRQTDWENGLDTLELAHREAHGLCGVGETLGFVGTGKVARAIEQLLLAALKAERALTDDESVHLREGIVLLRSTATVEVSSGRQQ